MYDFSSGNWPARNTGNLMSRIESLFFGLSKITNTKNIPDSLAFLTALWTFYNDKEKPLGKTLLNDIAHMSTTV